MVATSSYKDTVKKYDIEIHTRTLNSFGLRSNYPKKKNSHNIWKNQGGTTTKNSHINSEKLRFTTFLPPGFFVYLFCRRLI
jgi:hypothetical protein